MESSASHTDFENQPEGLVIQFDATALGFAEEVCAILSNRQAVWTHYRAAQANVQKLNRLRAGFHAYQPEHQAITPKAPKEASETPPVLLARSLSMVEKDLTQLQTLQETIGQYDRKIRDIHDIVILFVAVFAVITIGMFVLAFLLLFL